MSIDLAKQRILENVQLADLIGEKVQLQRKSGRFVGLCPFHEDKNPSFTLFEDHYFCFGCRARGDAINYVQQDQGLGFIEALKFLANKYNIAAPELEQSFQDHGQRQQLANIYQILQQSQEFFQAELAKPHGEACRRYLEQRGFPAESIKGLGFGFAPDLATGLVSQLLRQGFKLQDAVAASVATVSERDRKTYDFYRNRLMIPIHDHFGRIIAFGGRTMGDDPAKYKNSRETQVFDKSRVLYGFDQAKHAIREKKRAIVVEGYMDALQLRLSGFTETVACLGTALTIHHAKRLNQICSLVYLVFDGDEAGKRASLKTVDLAMSLPQLEFRVLRLPSKEDPDSFVRKNGHAAFETLIHQALDLLDFAITSKLEGSPDTAIPELVRQEFTPWLLSVKDPLRQSFLVGKIASLAQIPREDIVGFLRGVKKPDTKSIAGAQKELSPPEVKPSLIDRQPNRYEEAIIGHLYFADLDELDLMELRNTVSRYLQADSIWYELAVELIQSLRRRNLPRERGPGQWRSSVSEHVVTTLEALQKKHGAFVCQDRMQRIQGLITELRRKNRDQAIQDLKKQLSQGDRSSMKDILNDASKLFREK